MKALYEIDTWPWLDGLGTRLGRKVTLGDVPGEIWDEIGTAAVDTVWLMGVWERSPAGLAVARADEGLQREFRAALPDLRPEDVVGSPYCVRRYEVDEHLGGRAGLAATRAELKKRGLGLVLDYVPNHVAPDHPAVTEHLEWFITGTPADLAADPGAWFTAGDTIIARGRDPYFPPWPDVAQLNAFDPGLRDAALQTLLAIAEQCDGVRCDMAMLFFNDIFAGTWGRWAGPTPAREFWPETIAKLRAAHPGFRLIAEAYWDTEWRLQQEGFDLCYDKRLYDRLAHEDAEAVRQHLTAGRDFQDRLIRFIENHDEPRAASALPGARGRAAAVAIATLPGATLWHDGQFEGRRTKLPVFLGRSPVEPVDEELRAFYRKLPVLKTGEWRLLDCPGWPDNPSHHNVLAWSWDDHHLVVINFGDHQAQARVRLPWPPAPRRMTDLLDGRVFDRDGAELFVDLPAWGFHVLEVKPR